MPNSQGKIRIRETVYLIAEESPVAEQDEVASPLIDQPASRDIIIAIEGITGNYGDSLLNS